jgi:hypothetical protein
MKTLASLELIHEKVRNYGIWDFGTWNWFLWDLQKDLMGGNHMTLTMGPWFCNKSCTHGHYAGNGSLWCLKLSEFIWCQNTKFFITIMDSIQMFKKYCNKYPRLRGVRSSESAYSLHLEWKNCDRDVTECSL